jgi:hypothetical protein
MNTIQDIESMRDRILAEMRSIRSMRRGTLTEQYLRVPHKGKKEPVLRGPYYVFSRKEKKKTVGYRLTTPEELEAARRDVAAHKRFVTLCREFEEWTERLGALDRQGEDSGESAGEKKRRSSPSSRTKK